jgi:hypothetical protein
MRVVPVREIPGVREQLAVALLMYFPQKSKTQ